jgi:hypothetical protein
MAEQRGTVVLAGQGTGRNLKAENGIIYMNQSKYIKNT